jgi:hypothetical protein
MTSAGPLREDNELGTVPQFGAHIRLFSNTLFPILQTAVISYSFICYTHLLLQR